MFVACPGAGFVSRNLKLYNMSQINCPVRVSEHSGVIRKIFRRLSCRILQVRATLCPCVAGAHRSRTISAGRLDESLTCHSSQAFAYQKSTGTAMELGEERRSVHRLVSGEDLSYANAQSVRCIWFLLGLSCIENAGESGLYNSGALPKINGFIILVSRPTQCPTWSHIGDHVTTYWSPVALPQCQFSSQPTTKDLQHKAKVCISLRYAQPFDK